MVWLTRCASMLDLIPFPGLNVNDRYCDVTIVAGTRHFRAHRIVLAASCPYLFELFSNGAETVLRLGDVDPEVVMFCFTYIYYRVAYFPPFSDLDENTALQIHYLAGVKLRLTDLLHEFYDYLIENLISPQGGPAGCDDLLFVLRICHAIQDAVLTAKMKAHIVANLNDIFGSRYEDDYIGLKNFLFVLTAMEDWTEEAEVYKWRVIISWVRAWEDIRCRHVHNLIKKVEYGNLDKDFVYDVILKEGLLQAYPDSRLHILASMQPAGCGLNTRRSPISDIVVCDPETTLIRQFEPEEGWFHVYHAPMYPSEFLEVRSHRGKIYAGNGDEMWIFNGLSWLQVYPTTTERLVNTGCYNQIIGCGEYVTMVTCRCVLVYNITTMAIYAKFSRYLAGEGFCVASSGKRKIFVMGGSETEDAFVQIDLKSGRFKDLKPMTNCRDRGMAFYIDKTVVVFGRYTHLTMYYDVKRKKWETLHFDWKVEGNTKVFVIGRNLFIYEIDSCNVIRKIIDLPVEEFLEERAIK